MKKLLIGVVTSNIVKENASEVIQGIIAQAYKCKCDVAILSPLNNLQTIWNKHRETGLTVYQLISSPRFDGFIFDKRYIDNPEIEKLCESLLEKTHKTVMMVDGGKHKFFERISPKKTWEGFIGGALFSIAGSLVFWYFFPNVPVWQWIVFSILVVIFGTYGDLFESLLKRTVKIKDSGNILPGHGGILDRFDSLLFAIPVIYIYLTFLKELAS